MDEVKTILDAISMRISKEEGIDPDFVVIENRIGHVHLHVERPDLPQWPMAMIPGPEAISKDMPMQIKNIEEGLRTMIRAHLALKHVHDRFEGPPPAWATGIHPLALLALGRSSYNVDEMIKCSRSGSWRPEEREEYLLGDRSGLHLEIKMIRLPSGRAVRSRGSYGSLDIPRLPETTRTAMTGRRLSDFLDLPEFLEDLVVWRTIDRPDLGTTRIEIWADLVPIEEPPAGEEPWWVGTWSSWQDLCKDRQNKGA